MSSTTTGPSPSQNGSPKRGLAALLTNLNWKLDWKKDKKRILLMAGGALVAVVLVALLPHGDADANANSNGGSRIESNPIQALASMATKMRPDLEIVSVDGAAQTVTLKDKNGAVSTFKLDPQTKTLIPVPIAQPEVAETPQPPTPEQAAATLPEWMPVYPATNPEIVSSAVTPDGDQQTIATFKADDKPADIVKFYQGKLQESGFRIETASSGAAGGKIQAHDAEKKRMLILNVDAKESGTLSRVVTVQKK